MQKELRDLQYCHFANPNKIMHSGNDQQKMLKPLVKGQFHNRRIKLTACEAIKSGQSNIMEL